MTTLAGENGFSSNTYSITDNGMVGSNGEAPAATQEEPMQLDIVINNVVCSFSVRCHLNLRQIALQAANVEYRRENGMVTMKIRKPYTTASMWSSGKITCTGATSEELAKVAARRFARTLQNLGFKVRFSNYRVVNVLGTCTMPFHIRILHFSRDHPQTASYEPELHPGVTYKLKEPKATLKIFSTGSITVTAPCVMNVQAAIEHIFPIVYEYRHDPNAAERDSNAIVRINSVKKPKPKKLQHMEVEDDEFDLSSDADEGDYPDSDQSWE